MLGLLLSVFGNLRYLHHLTSKGCLRIDATDSTDVSNLIDVAPSILPDLALSLDNRDAAATRRLRSRSDRSAR